MNYETLDEALRSFDAESLQSLILSNPVPSKTKYRKIRAERNGDAFFVSSFTVTQVFHETVPAEKILDYCLDTARETYRQLNLWLSDGRVVEILLSKKGKAHVSVRADQPSVLDRTKALPNRQKNHILQEGMIVPPLVDMGVLTPEGKIIRSRYDKFKQINRFLEIIDDEYKDYVSDKPLRVIDFGCGKAYLTFVLYYYFTEIRHLAVDMTGLDLKTDVIEKCNLAARKYGYTGLRFEIGDIADYSPDDDIDMVITLHACDTATDYALYNAVTWNAKKIFSVPCCQHEINKTIISQHLNVLTRYGIIKERFSALLTDALRADILECCGYETQVLEFIDLEHTPKNIMLRAVKRPGGEKAAEARRQKMLPEIEAALQEFRIEPTLYKLLLKDSASGK
ncbi:class I SAM-dependent methyltransferase [Aristaeella lactis]|uniref:Methyltransferase domain-containing protein n=1 Tax=Aristaeella lactis TaxID=3046383 RepID=A0AC61PMG4_9FIRM|nr:SAM-dependent methyltransferase [Aristaeella lactis]QUA53157.1 SAM-dependent methyltransferase [Aristaeella lactis]SMC68388.1 Methyltransferase domain-containing protein [Aristaeella lactis]